MRVSLPTETIYLATAEIPMFKELPSLPRLGPSSSGQSSFLSRTRSWFSDISFEGIATTIVPVVIVVATLGVFVTMALFIVGACAAAVEELRNIEPRYYYTAAVIVVVAGLMAFLHTIGIAPPTLTLPTIRSRSCVLSFFLAVFLLEVYGFDIAQHLNISAGSSGPPITNDQVRGVLGALAVLFFVEYVYRYQSDLLLAWKERGRGSSQEAKPTPAPVVSGPMAIGVGALRVVFDVAIPLAACLYLFATSSVQMREFAELAGTHLLGVASEGSAELMQQHPELEEVIEKASETAGEIREGIESTTDEVLKEADELFRDIREESSPPR